MGIAGGRGKFATLVLDADIRASLRKGAPELSGERSDYSRNTLRLDRLGIEVPLEVNGAGQYVLNMASSGEQGRTLVE